MDQMQQRAHDLAIQIALAEFVRFALGEMLFSTDRAEFQRRLRVSEESVVLNLQSRKIWAQAHEASEIYVNEAGLGLGKRFDCRAASISLRRSRFS